jgi:hypothetical protein
MDRKPYDRATAPTELSGMTQRVLQSLVRRATDGDIGALEELTLLQREAREASIAAARGLVEGPGQYSWGEVGRWLGMTRQSARQRFGRR